MNGILSEAEIERRRKFSKVAVTHGRYKTPEYTAWMNMKARCLNPHHQSFVHYGGRGITVCERWKTFENFFADMGERPTAKSEIERIDNSLGYFPANCRWATRAEQMANTRRTIFIELRNQIKCLKAWCKELGQDYSLARNRIVKLKWSPAVALTKPADQKFNKFRGHYAE